jgi:hypothetical protein
MRDLRNGHVEAVAQAVFQALDNVAFVFERVGVLNVNF